MAVSRREIRSDDEGTVRIDHSGWSSLSTQPDWISCEKKKRDGLRTGRRVSAECAARTNPISGLDFVGLVTRWHR
jgi:hypothetical protein